MKRLAPIAVHVALVVAVALTLYPILWVLKLALSGTQQLSLSVNPLPTAFRLDNFAGLLQPRTADGTVLFWRQALNSMIIAAAVTVVGVLFSASAAYALSRFSFRGKDSTVKFLYLSQMMPGVVSMIPLYVLLDRLGLASSLFGLILVYTATAVPFCVLMLRGAYDALPRELDEAVLLDGGTYYTAFFRVALPLSRPALATTALFSFLTAWNEFILAATLMARPDRYTLPVAIQQYVGDFHSEWGHFAAGALVVSIPVMALFLVLERHLAGGLTQGAVKG